MKKVLLFICVFILVVTSIFANGSQPKKMEESAKSVKWQEQYPLIVISAVSSENEADRLARYKPLQDYLTSELGVKVDFFAASDYAGTIEAQAAGKVHFARYGTASYARAYRTTNGGVEAIMCSLNSDGSSGYHSVIWVKKDSPFNSVDDLKGASAAFADPNSTSGFLVPTYYLTKAGKDPDQFFGRTGFGGNHEGSILAVLDGTYDGAFNWYRSADNSNVHRMHGKGMIDESKLKMIWKSPVITNGPWAVIVSLPDQMKKDFTEAILNWPKKDEAGWKKHASPSEPTETIKVEHSRYADFIEMQKWVDAKEKEKASK